MSRDPVESGSCTRQSSGARRSAPVAPKAHGHDTELPLVIRPAPVRLRDVERRVRHDEVFAVLLRSEPAVRATVARAILARDEEARQRFGDVHTLADHLHRLRA